MSGRRRSNRYHVAGAPATLRFFRDVSVRCGADGEFVAVSHEPVASGGLLVLERNVSDEAVKTQVRVIESRPFLVSGSVRYRLRLKPTRERTGNE